MKSAAEICQARQLENAAFRKAGQAVAAAEIHLPFNSVAITDCDADMPWSGPGPVSDEQRRDHDERTTMVWLAGVLAEAKLGR